MFFCFQIFLCIRSRSYWSETPVQQAGFPVSSRIYFLLVNSIYKQIVQVHIHYSNAWCFFPRIAHDAYRYGTDLRPSLCIRSAYQSGDVTGN